MSTNSKRDYTKCQKTSLAKSLANVVKNRDSHFDMMDIENYVGQLFFGILRLQWDQDCLIYLKGGSSNISILIACSVENNTCYGIEIKVNGKKHTRYILSYNKNNIHIITKGDDDTKSRLRKMLKKKAVRKHFYTDRFLISKLESLL